MKKENRSVSITTPLGEDELIFYRLTGTEEMGRLFEFEIELIREIGKGSVDATDLLGKGMTVELNMTSGGTRYLNGVVAQFKHTGLIKNFSTYRTILRPWLWLLTLSADCKIFQDKSVVNIIEDVFADYSSADFIMDLSSTYETLDYCVQYRETDFDFISRLMEHHGIYYFFKHDDGKHQLIVTDDNSKYQTVSGYDTIPYFPPENAEARERDHISEWVTEHKVCSGKFELNDFDFEAPSSDLTAKSFNKGKHLDDDMEVYDYPGEYTKTAEGTKLTDTRIDESQTAYSITQGSGNAMGLQAGMEFTLEDFYFDEQNTKHYIVAATYFIEGDALISGMGGAGQVFHCQFTAINSTQQFRPVRVTKQPVIVGTQTAIVVGKSGEEIWTDKYGRVKVQFHWDRLGKEDENSTCWIRVSQPMAGKNWGWVSLPRIGQEVIVSFMEGNPDSPMITGRVYNAEQMPPYDLPENQTQSGIKTRSSKEGTAENFNEIRFEDKKGAEELYIHAEKNCNRVVENDDTLKVGFDKKDPGDQTIDIYNDRTETIEMGNETLTIKTGDRQETIEKGDDTLEIGMGNRDTNIKMGKDTLEAMQSIEMKVGSNSIKIDQSGITIKGIMVKIEGDAMAEMKSPMTTVKGDGILTLKGGITMIN